MLMRARSIRLAYCAFFLSRSCPPSRARRVKADSAALSVVFEPAKTNVTVELSRGSTDTVCRDAAVTPFPSLAGGFGSDTGWARVGVVAPQTTNQGWRVSRAR